MKKMSVYELQKWFYGGKTTIKDDVRTEQYLLPLQMRILEVL